MLGTLRVSSPSHTLDELYAKDRSHRLRHNGVLYTGIMRLIVSPEEALDVVIASGTTIPNVSSFSSLLTV
jgi:hypothetical protein